MLFLNGVPEFRNYNTLYTNSDAQMLEMYETSTVAKLATYIYPEKIKSSKNIILNESAKYYFVNKLINPT